MAKLFRDQKIASVLGHELNNIILRDLEFENTIVTITSVEVSPDLGQAKVRIGVIPEENSLITLNTLEKEKKELQYKVLKKTRLRKVPRLVFEIEKN